MSSYTFVIGMTSGLKEFRLIFLLRMLASRLILLYGKNEDYKRLKRGLGEKWLGRKRKREIIILYNILKFIF